MRTLRIDKETNPLGETKYYLMFQSGEGIVWLAIGFSHNEETILHQYEIAKSNLLLETVSTEVIKQETF